MKTISMNTIGKFTLALLLFFAVGSSTVSAQKNIFKQDIQQALDRLPTKSKLSKVDASKRKLIEETRQIWTELKAVKDFDSKEGQKVLVRVRDNMQELEEVVDRSCVQICIDEREACIINRCGGNTKFPCGCCVPCNLISGVCITDCLVDF